MSDYLYFDPSRLWYSQEVAIQQARGLASEKGVRQRVRQISPDSNVYECTWLIEEI